MKRKKKKRCLIFSKYMDLRTLVHLLLDSNAGRKGRQQNREEGVDIYEGRKGRQ